MPDPSRILIVRTSALGDVVHCLPVLVALRERFPDARIGWVVEEAMAPVVRDHPLLDETFVVRFRPWRRKLLAPTTLAEMARVHRRLRAFGTEVCLDLMGNHKAGLVARLSGAPERLGLGRGLRREPSSALWINRPVETPAVHAVDRALAVAEPLGISPPSPDPGAEAVFGGRHLFPRVPAAAERLLAERSEPFLILQAGAGWGNKTYPPPWWGRVAALLARRTGLESLVPIAPGEEELAHAVADAGGGAARVVEARGLDSLAALLRRARMVLGGDTGPVHLAHALGVPVLCLHGPTDPARHGPWGAPDRALAVRLPCSFCYKRYGEAKACLLSLTPERVAARAEALLEAGGATEPGGAPGTIPDRQAGTG